MNSRGGDRIEPVDVEAGLLVEYVYQQAYSAFPYGLWSALAAMPLDRFVYRLEYIQNEMGQATAINIS